MIRRAPAFAAALATLTVVVAAALAWWLDARTRPERVGPRFVDGLVTRHPRATATALDGGFVRVGLPSGVRVDVALSRVIAACAAERSGCTAAIDDALDDVDAADAATRSPERPALRPVVVAEGAGYRYGFVAQPLAGAYEVRYALVHRTASTFVTAAIAARLGLSSPNALRDAALANLDADRDVGIEAVDGSRGVYRVRASDDPAASLIDDARMTRFAGTIGSHRLVAAIPVRGTLALARPDAASTQALRALATTLRRQATTPDGGLLAWDVDAPQGARLSSLAP